jgi:hypothetical protein
MTEPAVVLRSVEEIAGIVLGLLLPLLVGLLVAGILIGVPAYLGYMAYQTAAQKDLFNPAALGFAAGFFALLMIAVIIGLAVVFAT